MKYYKIYGLVVCSAFAIPEALEIEETKAYDVLVELGNPPESDIQAAKDGKICRLEKNICWFYLENLGMFFVENGNHIIIWKETDALNDLARNSYLTGTTMALLMFQRDIVPLHSSCVSKDGKAILVVGNSGAGKSTNCMMLRDKGCRFMSDDVSPIEVRENQVYVHPAFPQQKLCKDTAIRRGYELKELIFIDEDRDKYAVRLSDGYEKNALPMAMIVELVPTNEKNLQIKEMRGLDKISLMYRNVYRGYALNAIGISDKMQQEILKVAETIPMYQIMRPIEGFFAEAITDWIIENL